MLGLHHERLFRFVDLHCLVGGVTGKGDAIGEVVAFFVRRLRSAADLVAQMK